MTTIGHDGVGARLWRIIYRLACVAIYTFLCLPILVIVPMSFNAEAYFTFTPAMLTLQPEGYSLRWYESFLTDPAWMAALRNSLYIAVLTTVLSVSLGTLAAVGLSRSNLPYRSTIMAIMISPLIVPVIITGAGVFFFYSSLGMTGTFTSIVLSHTVLATPFVVLTITATLAGFDHELMAASASLGASGRTTFFRIVVPLIRPGIISGAFFAFIVSFDEVVIALFLAGSEQQTVPRQMWSGIRDAMQPTILAVASILLLLSLLLLLLIEALRRRTARLQGRV